MVFFLFYFFFIDCFFFLLLLYFYFFFFFFSSRRRHTRYIGDWSSDVCSSDLPSRIMANSLARNSTVCAPSRGRGSLNLPSSKRLYHNTNPSRSQYRIFNRSPRREWNTNQCPLSGSSPITARTRSASRSNPQRMSMASLASQIRVSCARSIACKLGSPITTSPPPPPVTRAHARHRTRAPPAGSGHSTGGFQHACPSPRSAWSLSVALPGIEWWYLHSGVSSRRRNKAYIARAHGRTQLPSARYAPVRKSAPAISSKPSLCAVSWRNIATLGPTPQDVVR